MGGYFGLYAPAGARTPPSRVIASASTHRHVRHPERGRRHPTRVVGQPRRRDGGGQGNIIAFSADDGIVVAAGCDGQRDPRQLHLLQHGPGDRSGRRRGHCQQRRQGRCLANYEMDHPVFTSATLAGTTLTVAGYVGSAPNQTTFANARVELFESDNDGNGFGEGKTYLGFLTTDANGNFRGLSTSPARGSWSAKRSPGRPRTGATTHRSSAQTPSWLPRIPFRAVSSRT